MCKRRSHDAVLFRRAVAVEEPNFLRLFARSTGLPIFAANLGFSFGDVLGEPRITAAMDRLEQSQGDIINRYLA